MTGFAVGFNTSGQTGVALGAEIEDKMPQHEYYEYFGPDYTLHIAPSNMENKNSHMLLEEIRSKHLENLSRLQHAPSVQFQERPPDTELPEENEERDDPDERWDPDSNMEVDDERKPLPSRVKKEIVEPEVKDPKGTSESARSSGYDPAVDEITTGAKVELTHKSIKSGSSFIRKPSHK